MNLDLAIPESLLHELLDSVPIPPLAPVRYDMATPPALGDLPKLVAAQVQAARACIAPGQRIAVGVGSRGIAQLPEIVAALVRSLRDLGADPFLVPAMGSHGGATGEGQRAMLHSLGITEARAGAPIVAQMETVEVGVTPDGTPVRLDRLAAAADGIVFVARVKPHTSFRGPYESGLAKMIAIGFGKQAGASACHAQGFGQMHRHVPALAEVALARAPFKFALAVLENAYDQPFKVELVPAERMLAVEPSLLEEARAAMAHIPFDQLDVLVIDRIGKDISGDGADPNITGCYPTPYASGGPSVAKQVVLDLTDATHGNACGLGTADFTTMHAARKMSLAAMYANALTSTVVRPVAVPMVLPSDRLALAAALLTCNAVGRQQRLLRLQDTLHLGRFWVSAGLLEEVQANSRLYLEAAPAPACFDDEGNLFDHGCS